MDSTKKRGGEILDVAQDLAESLFARWESRFLRGGLFPLCRLFLDSSRQYPDDYVERVERQILAGKFPYPAKVFSLSQWEAKRGVRDASGKLAYSGEMFPVEVASGTRVSRILERDEVDHAIGRVVWCAVEHRPAFETDTDKALRDLAGVAVEGLHPLIPQKELLIECIRTEEAGFAAHQVRHPFSAATTTLSDSVDFISELLIDPVNRRPWVNPYKLRVAHCDPGVTGDAFGICVGHVSDVVTVNRLTDGRLDLACPVCLESRGHVRCARCLGEGFRTIFGRRVRCQSCAGVGRTRCPSCRGSGLHGTPLQRPRIYTDLALRITPPKAGRIQFDNVEALLDRLRAGGFMIAVVTADGHQSEQFLQRQLNKPGVVLAEHLSVDKTKDPYYFLRDAVMDRASDGLNRLNFYNYAPLFDELRQVEDRRDKIEHPKQFSKDVADGLAGVVYSCEVHEFLRESVAPGTLDVRGFSG